MDHNGPARQHDLLSVRTDFDAKQQEGISFLLIDMNTPGVEVRPIKTMDGGHEINTVTFDNVRVPVENRVGEENKGWTYAKYLLGHERNGIAAIGRSKHQFERLKTIARAEAADDDGSLIEDADFARKMASVQTDIDALKLPCFVCVGRECRPCAGTGNLDIENQRHRDSANAEQAALPGGRCLRAAVHRRIADGRLERNSRWSGLRSPVGAAVLQCSKDFDLRRQQRNSKEHHRKSSATPIVRTSRPFGLETQQHLRNDTGAFGIH